MKRPLPSSCRGLAALKAEWRLALCSREQHACTGSPLILAAALYTMPLEILDGRLSWLQVPRLQLHPSLQARSSWLKQTAR